MKTLRFTIVATFVVTLALTAAFTNVAHSQGVTKAPASSDHQTRRDRFRPNGVIQDEDHAGLADHQGATEAPTGFDNLTNGFTEQGPPFDTINENNVAALRSFNDNRFIFEEVETIGDGLGPTYNAQSCRECHQNVVTGGASQVAEHRTGRLNNDVFFESLGGSLIQARATHPDIVEQVDFQDDIQTFRISTNTLGNGFVESLANGTLLAIRDRQPEEMRGTALMVPVLEANSSARIGRFGWKSQHASLESFSADAYLNEMGITSPLFPEENTSSGRFVGFGSGFDPIPDPEDDGTDIVAFANFMRSTKAPSRGPITPDVRAGEALFTQIGCAICHTASITTALPARGSTAARSPSQRLWVTRSSLLTAISCYTTSGRATAYLFSPRPNLRQQ